LEAKKQKKEETQEAKKQKKEKKNDQTAQKEEIKMVYRPKTAAPTTETDTPSAAVEETK